MRKKISDRKNNVPVLLGIDGLCSVLISLVDQLASLYEQDDQRRALLFKGLSDLVSRSFCYVFVLEHSPRLENFYDILCLCES